jgi:hypothetical protein
MPYLWAPWAEEPPVHVGGPAAVRVAGPLMEAPEELREGPNPPCGDTPRLSTQRFFHSPCQMNDR